MNIKKFLTDKNKSILYVLSGISASGKTTLAKKMQKDFKYNLLSLDNYKEKIYENYGFKNNMERKILLNMAKNEFQSDIIKLARTNQNIIIEYPFDITWQNFFDYIGNEYNYLIVIVNCNTRTFEDIWTSRIERDSNEKLRPLSLTAKAYIKDILYENNGKLNDMYKKEKEIEYIDSKYTSLKGDYVFNDLQVMKIFVLY